MMQLTISKSVLLPILSTATKFTVQNGPVPLLDHILFKCINNVVSVHASSISQEFMGSCSALVTENGNFCVNAATFMSAIKNMPLPEVTITTIATGIKLQSGSAVFKLRTAPEDTFISLTNYSIVNYMQMPSAALIDLLEKSKIAAHPDTDRINLNGVMLTINHTTPNNIDVAASNGTCLSYAQGQVDNTALATMDIFISLRAVNSICASLDANYIVEFGTVDNAFVVKQQDRIMSFKTVCAQLPDYTQLISIANPNKLFIKTNVFMDILQRTGTLAEPPLRGLLFKFSSTILTVQTDCGEDEATQDVAIEYTGPDQTIKLSSSQLLAALSNVQHESVVLEVSDAIQPVLLKSGNPLEVYTYISSTIRMSSN